MGVDAPAAANPASMLPADRAEAPLLEMRSITKRFPGVLAEVPRLEAFPVVFLRRG